MSDTSVVAAERSRAAAIERLTANEQLAYEQYVRTGQSRLSPQIAKTMFDLYVQGFSMEDLQGLNPVFPFGMLVQAKVDGLWDERRDAYIAEVLADVPSKLRLTAAEAVGFMALQLQVAHKVQGEKLKRYLQTGETKDLGDGFHIESMKTYKSCIESLAKLLEVSTPKREGAPSPFQPTPGQGDGSGNQPLSGGENRYTPAEADAIRASLERKGGR